MHPVFFFNDTATTEIYTLSLHDALPISHRQAAGQPDGVAEARHHRTLRRHHHQVLEPADLGEVFGGDALPDRKSTRLNSSHSQISYAVFCLKKKKKYKITIIFHMHTVVV